MIDSKYWQYAKSCPSCGMGALEQEANQYLNNIVSETRFVIRKGVLRRVNRKTGVYQ